MIENRMIIKNQLKKLVNDKKEAVVVMTKNLWKDYGTKLLWIAIPLFISLMIWLVSMTFTTQGSVKAIETQQSERAKLDDKMWDLVQQNNRILQDKADQESNEREHKEIMGRLSDVEVKLDKIYRKHFTSYGESNMKKDSILFTPGVWENITYNKTKDDP